MTRISDRKLVQRVEDNIVIIDQDAGEEVVLTPAEFSRALRAIEVLYTEAELEHLFAGELAEPRSL